MLITIVSATEAEILPTIKFLSGKGFELQNNKFQLLITGVGMMATSYALTKHISYHKPDLLIQAGIAGSFSDEVPILSTVFVEKELLGDLGVMESGEFKDVFDLGLTEQSIYPFNNKALINPYVSEFAKFGYNTVKSLTVNEISTSPERINNLITKYEANLESMEGAAFHYVCLQEKKRFIQIRTVSNRVGERDKSKWKLKDSITVLNEALTKLIQEIV